MTPEHVVGLFGFGLNYGIACYGYVNILHPRWSKLRTWMLSVGIVSAALLVMGDAIFVPAARMVTVVPLCFVLLLVFYRDRFSAKTLTFVVMCITEFICDAASWWFVGLTYPVHDREVLDEKSYTPEFIFPRLFYAALLFVFVSILIVVNKRLRSSPMKQREQSLTVFASLQVFAQAIFLSFVLNSVETTINPAYYALLFSFDVGALVSLGLFLSLFRHQSLQEARMQALEAQKQMRDRYAASLASYAGTVGKLRGELERAMMSLQEQIETASPARWQEHDGGAAPLRFQFSHQYSDRIAVNSLVTEKEKTAQSCGIEFECRTILDVPQLSEFALCTVLANMLDNAIEAASKVDGRRWIALNCIVKAGQRSLVCTNAAVAKHVKPKKDPREHGLGLAIIRTTVTESGGDVYVKSTPNQFMTMVVFPSSDMPSKTAPQT